jgi:hypothetical protein
MVWTPGGHFSGNFASGGVNAIHVTDGTFDNIHTASGAAAYQASQDATLSNLLYGGPAQDLNNTGLPVSNSSAGPMDAFEWTLTVPANGSQTVSSSLVITNAVPEPGSLALFGSAVGGAMAIWRFLAGRRKRSQAE